MKFGQRVGVNIVKNRDRNNGFKIGGVFTIQCLKHNKLKWSSKVKNGVTNVGVNSVLDVYFNNTDTVGGVSSTWQWALGLINNSPAPTLNASDTHASHAGWAEFTSYEISANANIRPEWNPDPASSQAVSNPTLVEFDITGTGTLYGLFVVGGAVPQAVTPAATDADNKGSTNATPLLWATAALDAPQPVDSGDLIRITYEVLGSSA